MLLAHVLSDEYSAVDSETEPFDQPQVVAGSVGGGVCQSNVTH
jgi:hypothetical protein